MSLAIITFFYDWEWEKAERAFKRAITLNPNNAEALSYYAMFLGFEERFDEAIGRGKRALEIDPLSPLINMNVGWAYFSAGLSDQAFDQAGKMIEIDAAIEWFEKAFEERNGEMVFLKGEISGAADGDSLNSLGGDLRLVDLLRKMNLP